MPIYSFICEDCGEYDAIVHVGSSEHVCRCGKTSKKSIKPSKFSASRGVVEVQEMSDHSGTIVRHGDKHYFRPDKERYSRDAVQFRAAVAREKMEERDKVKIERSTIH